MDKNTYTGAFLIILIVLGSFYFLKPSAADIQKEKLKQHQDSLKKAAETKTPATTAKFDTTKKLAATDTALLKSPFGIATVGSEKLITLENKELLIKLSTRGGRVASVELKNFKTWEKKPLVLFDGDKNHFGLTFRASRIKASILMLFILPRVLPVLQ